VDTLSSFPGIKRPERVADHSLLRSTKFMNEWSYTSNPPQLYELMGNTLHLVSNRVRCEGKRAMAIFWLEIFNRNTASLDSKPVSAVHKPHKLPLISLALCGNIWLTVWVSVLEIVHRVYLFYDEHVLQASASDSIYRCSPAAMIHAT